jgi:hypothetical protein
VQHAGAAEVGARVSFEHGLVPGTGVLHGAIGIERLGK